VTTEFLLLLIVFVYIVMGAMLGPNGMEATFRSAGPALGARVEKQLETGSGFQSPWKAPDKTPPIKN
jgi:hypothetical protein